MWCLQWVWAGRWLGVGGRGTHTTECDGSGRGWGIVLKCSLQDRTASKFYLNGYSRFSQEAREFAVEAALVSRVAEGFQHELLQDNRVGVVYKNLWGAATKELRWVIDLPYHLYEKLSTVAGPDFAPWVLRDETIAGAHTSYHFLWRRVLVPAGKLPWTLCRGDIRQNLKDLAAQGDAPDEPFSHNLWHLLQKDYPGKQLVAVVELLGECPWSSMPAEQQHASVAQLHRWHPEYQLHQLLARSLVHATVRLLPNPNKLDKQIARLSRKLDRVQAKQVDAAGPSHLMVKALVAVAKGKKEF